jgi:F-type H+-transporting ATPase subunit delta
MRAKSAERYAQALVDLGGKSLRNEFNKFKETLSKSDALRTLLSKDIFSVQEKQDVIKNVSKKMSLSTQTTDFLLYLAEMNRFPAFFDIHEVYTEKLNQLENISEASVESANELPEAEKKKLKSVFEKQTGRKLNVHYEVNPSLLGGVVTRIGNHVYDGSIQTQLKHLESTLEKGGW